MKNIVFICLFCFGVLHAQTTVSDSVVLGPGYSNMVYYNLGSGAQTVVPAAGWDLQIWTNLMSASVRTNDAAGVQLYEPVNHDTAFWTSLDTTGMVPVYNADTSWEVSAFNAHQTGHPNYGWGVYQGAGNLLGIKIFVIKTANGNYKKIWIKRLVSGDEYQFTVANLDGSQEQTFSIRKSDYGAKAFVMYGIDSMQIIDAEPDKTNWDIVFRKYWATDTSYVVTGVLSHPDVQVAEARGVDVSSDDYAGLSFSSNISVIGYDWKSFNMSTFQWQLADSLAYFIEAQDGFIYKVVFTAFGGSSSGKVVFAKTQLPGVTAVHEKTALRTLSVSPNPVAENTRILFSVMQNDRLSLTLHDVTGKQLFHTVLDAQAGLNVYPLQTESLTAGFYLLTLEGKSGRLTYRLLRQ
ncbi:MAG: hypothetical protein KatS3mg031_0731 [Chitinophagales bacterium]|nr:MAG: hypothetical protein KatS3mg031_0731 [Chitinophagales bacterium]